MVRTAVQPILRRPDLPLDPLPTDPAARIAGLNPLITPIDSFFRVDIAEEIPIPSVDAWTMRIDGMVRTPLELNFDDLLARELVEVDATIACVSNSVGGFLVGNARWTGVRLDALLAEAQPLTTADEVLGHGLDGFTAGFPTALLDGRDALVAVGMNGELLQPKHGYPARIVVPGLYGYVSAVKWLTRIELTRFEDQVGYWIPRGWSRLAPVKLASKFDTPRPRQELQAGSVTIGGVAWSAASGISAVQVQVDEGPWLDTELGPELTNNAWRQWWLGWDAVPGEHRLRVRAVDGSGARQSTKEVPPLPNGAEGLHTIDVTVV